MLQRWLWLENIDYYLYDILIFRKWIPKWPIQIIKSSLTKILLRICLGITKANQANDYWKLVLCHPRNGDYEVLFRPWSSRIDYFWNNRLKNRLSSKSSMGKNNPFCCQLFLFLSIIIAKIIDKNKNNIQKIDYLCP